MWKVDSCGTCLTKAEKGFMARSAGYPRYPQRQSAADIASEEPERLATSNGSQSLMFASKFAPFSQGWRGLNATAFVYPGNGKDVQPLQPGSVAQGSRLSALA